MTRPPSTEKKPTHDATQTQDEAILETTVAPAGAGKFTAYLDGHELRELCVSTKPFLDGARVLLAEGVDPATVPAMRHAGNNTLTLRSRVGVAAELTVLEGDGRPRFGTRIDAVLPDAPGSARPLTRALRSQIGRSRPQYLFPTQVR
jgi:hypothetical protein